MNARLAVHLPEHQLPELQKAARSLLRQPLITTQDSEDFRLILKWETVLRNEFTQKLGYRLDVNRTAARLLRRPASLTPWRGARLGKDRSFSRWGYVYLCLTLAALEQPGHQVLASELLSRIAQVARGDIRLQLDSTQFVQRRAFRDAVRYLEQIGVLTVRDGDVDLLVNDGQVLWDIDRDAAAMCMVASPSVLRSVASVDDFIVEPTPGDSDGRSRRARHLLNRRMVDQPVVVLSDLTPDEAELAWRNRRREAENISRLTGCNVELRKEGLALIDHPNQPLGVTQFPGSSAVCHAALLLLSSLLERATRFDRLNAEEPPTMNDSVEANDDAKADANVEANDDEVLVTTEDVDDAWSALLEDYSARLSKEAREQPDKFRFEVLMLLQRFGLISTRQGGLAVAAVANRFRAQPVFVNDPVLVDESVLADEVVLVNDPVLVDEALFVDESGFVDQPVLF